MLTPPGGSLGSTLWVLVGAEVVFSEPVFVALVAPDLVDASPLEDAVASPLASAVVVASSALVVCGLRVSAGELSESNDPSRLVGRTISQMEMVLLLSESCLGCITASMFCTDGGHGQADDKDVKRKNAKRD